MNTQIQHQRTSTGTKAITISEKNPYGLFKTILLITDDGLIISKFKEYPGLSDSDEVFKIEGTQVDKYFKSASFQSLIHLAARKQQNDGIFHYNNPIHKILETLENPITELYVKCYLDEVDKNTALLKRIAMLKEYGTEDPKKIAKIIKERQLAASKQAKIDAKVLKAKIAENEKLLKAKLKEGYTHIAVVRSYSNKGRKFLGEVLEYRTSKPQTAKCYTLDKESLGYLAKIIVKN